MVMVVTTAIIRSEPGRFWLMRRTDKCRDEHGNWDTCAGALEEGCRAEDNMRREIVEELTAPPLKLSFIGWSEVFRPDNRVAPHVIRLDFLADVREEGVVIAEPHKFSDGGWFSLSCLPSPLHSQVTPWLKKYSSYLEVAR
jgi:ADP-ribose pyrophosphatase YjhB (NUDIX family)